MDLRAALINQIQEDTNEIFRLQGAIQAYQKTLGTLEQAARRANAANANREAPEVPQQPDPQEGGVGSTQDRAERCGEADNGSEQDAVLFP